MEWVSVVFALKLCSLSYKKPFEHVGRMQDSFYSCTVVLFVSMETVTGYVEVEYCNGSHLILSGFKSGVGQQVCLATISFIIYRICGLYHSEQPKWIRFSDLNSAKSSSGVTQR